MANPNLKLQHTVSPQTLQRTVLVGRVKMAQAIKLPETDWARYLSEVEKDPLFQELLSVRSDGRKIVRFKRFGSTRLAGQFYEMQDVNIAGGSDVSTESLLDQKKHLLELIKKMGQEKFERYFLYREVGETPEHIAASCELTLSEAKQLQELIMDVSVQAEFYHPSVLSSQEKVKPTLIGQIVRNEDKTYSIAFFYPHLARGMYDIDRAALRRWQKTKKLDREASFRLRRYVGLLELSNMRQGAFWRVNDYLLKTQKPYFDTQDPTKMAPVSLRKVAKDLQFAPSTISRVMGSKSIRLPWGHEVSFTDLMPGQRQVVLHILEKLQESQKNLTDAELAQKIESGYGVSISRRTVTACRHVLEKKT